MNFGLVLSGGMAKGAYQMGVLKAIKNYLTPNQFKYISCSSVGVLNGYSFVTDKMMLGENMWRHICQNKHRQYIQNVLKSDYLQQSIFTLYSGSKTLKNDFYISLFDVGKRNVTYKNLSATDNSAILRYLQASVAMPVYNKSVFIDGARYFDGAIIDNIPVAPLIDKDVDFIICVYFDTSIHRFETLEFDKKIIKIVIPPKTTITDSIIFEQNSINQMINDGYVAADRILRYVFKNGTDDYDKINTAVTTLNQSQAPSNIRITGDVMVKNLNRISQMFVKKHIE
jgi:predicted acylesterase/phospholipase RssA